jgi:hypothetical protein
VCGSSVDDLWPQGSSNLHFVLSAAIPSAREFQYVDLNMICGLVFTTFHGFYLFDVPCLAWNTCVCKLKELVIRFSWHIEGDSVMWDVKWK